MRRIWMASCALVVSSAAVGAFPFANSWHMPATGVAGQNRCGAGGIYATGARTDHSVKCQHCHIPNAATNPGTIAMMVAATPAFGKKGNDDAYTPGTRYTLTISMVGEHRFGMGSADNANAMAAVIEDASGHVAGRYIADDGHDSASCPATYPYSGTPPAGKTTLVYGDCHGVLPLAYVNQTHWTFDWVAPAAGTGDVTMFVGMVDGDHDGGSSLDDDAIQKAYPLREGP
ncbi:MAG: hypothetical protein QM831_23870 [Kofleriaceae bacterium]